MMIIELLTPGQGATYTWGDVLDGSAYSKHAKIAQSDPAAKTKYFRTDGGQLYAVNFDQSFHPAAVTLSFGNVDPWMRIVNYSELSSLTVSQAAKILNTVIAAAEEFAQAQGGVPLWVFTAYSVKKAKVYKMLAKRLARHLQGDYLVVKSKSMGYLFMVYFGHQGLEDMNEYLDHIKEYESVEENPSEI
jgi:hypothetical protein